MSKKVKIMLTGGGTLGSVTPLVAIWQEIKEQNKNSEVVFVGTKNGVEKDFIVKNYKIPYFSISSGKLRRYISLKNITDIYRIIKGFFDSYVLLKKVKPSAIITAGSFVSVPLVIVGWWLKIPVFVHQLDIKVGLANKIMAKFARKITITFGDHFMAFPEDRTILTGSPVRKELLQGKSEKAVKSLGLSKKLPTILILGGGIGAQKVNDLISRNLDQLLQKYNVIHSTGRGKLGNLKNKDTQDGKYRVFEFIDTELADYYALADLIVTRAGLGTLAEVLAVHKPMIIIPIHKHQQEKNAFYFQKKGVGLVVEEIGNFDEKFLHGVKELMTNEKARDQIKDIAEKTKNHVAAMVVAKKVLQEIK